MSLGQTVGTALLLAVLGLVLRESKSGLAPLLLALGGAGLLAAGLSRLCAFSSLSSFLTAAGLEEETETVAKVLSVGFLTSFGADTCAELGAPSLGSKLELCGRIEILVIALPTLNALLSGVLSLLSS